MRTVVRAAGALSVAAVLAGCGFMQRQAFIQPEVDVTDVRIAGIGLTGGTLEIILGVYNPNNFRLDASQLSYRALVDTLELAKGTITPRVTLLPKDTTEIRVPVSFGFAQVNAVGRMVVQRGTVPVQIVGDVQIETPAGSVTRTFDQRGTWNGVSVSILPRRR